MEVGVTKEIGDTATLSPELIEKSLNKLCHPISSPAVAYISGCYRSRWGFIGVAINILKARRVAIKYWQKGYACICPHMNTAFMPEDHKIDGDLEFIKRLKRKKDVIVMMRGFKKSQGSLKELALAKYRRLKAIYE